MELPEFYVAKKVIEIDASPSIISKELLNLAIKNHTPNCEEARGLGFKLEGDFFGHTGFTGTSLFVDNQTGLWGVLLTNAVAFGRENKSKYIDIRKQFYDTIIDEYMKGNYNGNN